MRLEIGLAIYNDIISARTKCITLYGGCGSRYLWLRCNSVSVHFAEEGVDLLGGDFTSLTEKLSISEGWPSVDLSSSLMYGDYGRMRVFSFTSS